jgi:hypothetical protein
LLITSIFVLEVVSVPSTSGVSKRLTLSVVGVVEIARFTVAAGPWFSGKVTVISALTSEAASDVLKVPILTLRTAELRTRHTLIHALLQCLKVILIATASSISERHAEALAGIICEPWNGSSASTHHNRLSADAF